MTKKPGQKTDGAANGSAISVFLRRGNPELSVALN